MNKQKNNNSDCVKIPEPFESPSEVVSKNYYSYKYVELNEEKDSEEQSEDVSQFYEGLIEMVSEHQSKREMIGLQRVLPRLLFGEKPENYTNSERTFKKWFKDNDRAYYQGEVDSEGRKDGRGI